MGLGWTHNHAISLELIPGVPNRIVVRLPRGGDAYYTEVTSNQYAGVAGIDSAVKWNPSISQYTLTTTDGSQYIFDSAGKIVSRIWQNGNLDISL